MLVLLPPSEGKTAPPTGSPVALASLSHPELSDARRRVGDALMRASGARNAGVRLGVGPSLAPELARNTTLWSNPAAPAARVYTGVLYEAARMASWDGAMLARGSERLRIVSALWGALSPADAIPAYRLSMATTLPRLGGLASFWRGQLGTALDPLADGRVVIDCRSSTYAAAWTPRAGTWVTVRVLRELNGTRSVVSHMAKHTRGLLAGHLMTLATPPRDPEGVADAATAMVGDALVDATLQSVGKGAYELTLVIAG